MNRAYRLLWSEVHQAFVVAAEIVRARGKRSGATLVLAAVLGAVLPAWAANLPEGGHIVAGSGSIAQSGTTMTVTQATERMAANWQSFSIGQGYTVQFLQPSSSAIALNRVLGSDVSVIQGALRANGQVYLINPNGVLFTPTARVDVGGLIASTLNLSNEDFLAGRLRFAGDSTRAVVNQGDIHAGAGGTVALIAARIENTGAIEAPQGKVLMGAGRKVTLDLGGPVNIQVEEGALDALIAQGGAIKADGGLVYLTAQAAGDLASAVINHTGITEAKSLATGERGEIVLMGDMARGEVHVAGTLDASAPAGLQGGFVETSAARVTVAEGAQVKAGHWLIDPNDFTIAASGGDITGSAISTALGSGNVTIQTTATTPSCTGVSCGSGTSGNGDIFVRDNVTWSSGNTLTLLAHRNIEIRATLDASAGGGKVMLAYGQGALAAGNTATYSFGLTGSGFTGKINLQAGNNFSTKLGSDGSPITYTVITQLGNQGDQSTGPANSLQGLAHSSKLSGNYALGADIGASATSGWNGGAGFVPIGTFTGRFDGLGHTISNLLRNPTGWTLGSGLFGSSTGSLRNIGVVNASISGSRFVGGLVGENQGSITNSYATGTMSAEDTVGGLVGRNVGGTIAGSYATGTITATSLVFGSVGGLVGSSSGGSITNSYATGTVSGSNNVGGLVGSLNDNSSITNSYATGAVNATGGFVGGLVGSDYGGTTIMNSYATGNVTATGGNYVGGLLGYSNGHSSITDSYATGAVAGASSVGGLVGFNRLSISNSYATGAVTGNNLVGGLVGYNDGNVSNSYATGDVNATGSFVGGLVGENWGGSIATSYATGAVTGTGLYVGGLVGENGFTATVSTSYATGAVTGTNEVGGLVGENWGSIANSYATGAVTGNNNVGGLVGRNDDTIANSYATGRVNGSGADVGGLVGLFEGGTVSDSFWDTTTSGQSSSAAGTGLTTAQMKQLSTYTAVGWDIDDAGGTGKVWRIYDGASYPLLRSFLMPLTIVSATDGSKVYDGNAVNTLPGGLFTFSGSYDSSKILFGGTLPGQTDVGTYTATIYSGQTGYDLSGTRSVTYTITPSSPAPSASAAPPSFPSAAIAQAQGLAGEAARAVSPLAGVAIRVAGTGIRLPEGYLLADEEKGR